jgi:hypothetical protein
MAGNAIISEVDDLKHVALSKEEKRVPERELLGRTECMML